MSEIRVATRYARSLFDLASEKNLLKEIEGNALDLIQLIHENHGFNVLLQSPIITSDKKWKIIDKLTSGRVNEMMTSFIKIILRKNREAILEIILRQFVDMHRDLQNIISATVVTAYPISDSTKQNFENYLTQTTKARIELSTKIDEKLLGGFVLRYEDKLVDASVSTQLRNLRKQLINN